MSKIRLLKVKKALLSGKRITKFWIRDRCGLTNEGDAIHQLRKRYGMKSFIYTEMKKNKNGKRYAEYFIPKELLAR